MTQEDKELVLIDLSGRVRYGVRLWLKCFEKQSKYFIDAHNILGSVIYDKGSEYKISLIDKGEYSIEGHSFSNYEQVIKPYLRPMSSMTEEEKNELRNLLYFGYPSDDYDRNGHRGIEVLTAEYDDWNHIEFDFENFNNLIDWLNAHHFDYRGLIEKGLALEAPKDIYK